MKDCAQPLQHIEHGIPPVFDERSEVLVLGTMPSPKSREAAFFYGHPQNRFWRVLAAMFDEPVPEDNAERADLLLRHHIALWDVLESCDIRGASDASIANARPNDLSRVLEKASVRRVFCTGAAAGRYYAKLCAVASGLPASVLPSPSPANAAWSLPRLVEAYRPVADAVTPFTPPVLEVPQVVALEQAIAEAGTPLDALMRRAGRFLAFEARKALEGVEGAGEIVILCGNGNNGGDGFVVARKLAEESFAVTAVLLCGQPKSAQAREMYSRMEGLGVSVLNLETEPYMAASAVREAQLVVDAVYGIGFHGDLPDYMRPLFRQVNAAEAITIAIDVPSGMDCDTGLCDPDTLAADRTITFTAMKPGLLSAKSSAVCGAVEVVGIGIDERLIDQFTSDQSIIDWDMVAHCFQPRPADSHKGTYGHLLSVCGSYGMAGAAILAARAALRCGAGLVTAAMPASVYPLAAGSVPEALFLPLPETGDGLLAMAAREKLRERLARCTAVLVGCGLGCGGQVPAVVEDVLRHASCPVVLDADGINCVAQHIDIRKTTQVPLVLTPHPGEMARLLGCSIEQVQDNRLETARRFAEEQQVILVLKGSKTVVAAPGQTLLVNTTGNPGMATGGSGDVLAGMIASFIAQGMEPYRAAMCGVYLHGLAGDAAAHRISQHAMLPSDLLEELGGLFLRLE